MNPMLIAAAIAALAGTAQGIAKSTTNNKAQRHNKAALEALMAKEEQGNLGMSPEEKQQLSQQLNVPVQQAAAQGQQRAEQIAAASGQSSGADLSRLRTERDRATSTGAQQAALAVSGANQMRADEQRNELEQRLGMQTAMRQDDWKDGFMGLNQGATVLGGAMAAPPGSTTGATGSGATPPAAAGAPGATARTSVPGATGAPDAAGAGEAIAGGAPAGMMARTAEPTSSGPPAMSETEMKQMRTLAEQNPQLFAQMFLARYDSTGRTV